MSNPERLCGYRRNGSRLLACRLNAQHHVLLRLDRDGDTVRSMMADLCPTHAGRAFQDGAIAAHPLAWDCVMPGTVWSDDHTNCHVDGTGVNPYDTGEVSSDA
jgi:hypothetical protein